MLNQVTKELPALWRKFTSWEIPVHSLLVSQCGDLLWERYCAPYGPDTLHRMFSITKSYCSLAIGCLTAEGKLSLDDPIIRFFPEYLPADGSVHPYLAEMTIRHMLTMQTCHSATTYRLHPEQNWVESFFTVPPTHRSGQIFLYDTSSSHTLGALINKLTGMSVLDYLRTRFLDEAGFSKNAYIIRDPFGAEMGGSGLMARPMDLMNTAQYLLPLILHGKDSFSAYLREATQFQVPTLHSGQTLDEQQGYGYQFWRIRDGFAMYGMGGQYVLFYPQFQLIFVITADSQNIKGGTQKILDAVHDTVMGTNCPMQAGTMPCFPGQQHISELPPASRRTEKTLRYRLLPCKSGFTGLSLVTQPNGGCLILEHPDAGCRIPFGIGGTLRSSTIAKYHQPVFSSGTWLDEDTLFICTRLVGESTGSLFFLLHLRPDGVTVWMKKVEESYFDEFCDFAEGTPC